MLRNVKDYLLPDALAAYQVNCLTGCSTRSGPSGGGDCSSNSKGGCSSGYNAYQKCSGLSTTNGCSGGKGSDGSRKDGENR